MLEIIALGFLLIISLFLAVVNWRIFLVTVKMLDVTIEIHHKTIDLLEYTKKTYDVLGGEEGLTPPSQSAKIISMQDIPDVYEQYI
tara:strand:+ start:2670 stop:2927 length:258 start_codon:yes stop_codon:yes gene_type:complete